tara:strand:+ start:82 stop:789 length:708 start_codon:yes stop_codon:yes gene_type:complete
MEIKNILYINLDNRPDRRLHVEKQLESVGMNGTRFSAIKMENGRIGCSMSHLKCLQKAKENNWDHVFICEDDITFTKPGLFKQQLNKFLTSENSAVSNWDVCIVGGNNLPPFKQIDDYCIRVSHCQTTTGYIVKGHYFDKLIENYREGISRLIREPEKHVMFAIDKHWLHLQKQDRWFLITPATVIQLEDYSDIEKRVVNYNWHMLDLEKREFIERQKKMIEQQTKMQSIFKQKP